LNGSLYQEVVKVEKTKIFKVYNIINDYYQKQGFVDISYEEFEKYTLLVSSRMYQPTVGGELMPMLVPMADLFNMKGFYQTEWSYDVEKQGFVVKSNEEIQVEDEICINYGDHINNFTSFLWYGYVAMSPKNVVMIRLDLDETDSLYPQKQEWLNNTESEQTFKV
jgi:hypothetical protein